MWPSCSLTLAERCRDKGFAAGDQEIWLPDPASQPLRNLGAFAPCCLGLRVLAGESGAGRVVSRGQQRRSSPAPQPGRRWRPPAFSRLPCRALPSSPPAICQHSAGLRRGGRQGDATRKGFPRDRWGPRSSLGSWLPPVGIHMVLVRPGAGVDSPSPRSSPKASPASPQPGQSGRPRGRGSRPSEPCQASGFSPNLRHTSSGPRICEEPLGSHCGEAVS